MNDTEARCVQIAQLPAIKGYDLRSRVYSAEGLSPTIRPCGGGNNEPKILIAGQLPGYEKNGRIYAVGGIAPTIQSRDYKDAAKTCWRGDNDL